MLKKNKLKIKKGGGLGKLGRREGGVVVFSCWGSVGGGVRWCGRVWKVG